MTLTIFTFSFQVPCPLGRNLSPSQVLNSKERGFQWEPHLSTRKGILRTVEGEGGFSLQTCSPMKVKVLVIQSCLTLCNPMDCSLSGPSVHGILQPRTRVGCYALLQWIFLTQRSNPGILHCRQILYCLSHQGYPLSSCICTTTQFSKIYFCGRRWQSEYY